MKTIKYKGELHVGIYDNFKSEFENYRKYVWNDFSIVEKARIQIIESGNDKTGDQVTIGTCVPGSKNELTLKEDLPVQINPSEFDYKYRINTKVLKGIRSTNKLEGVTFVSFGGDYDGSIEIPLIFDIYDEYNARTMNGTMTKDFSLTYAKSTSLPALIYYATEGAYYARFIWGDIAKFGLLSGVDVSYTAFSPWGQPLKANARVYITEMPIKGGDPRKLKIGNDLSGLKTTGKKIMNGIKNIFR